MNNTSECYECGGVGPLSPRSRCVECEHRRAVFNEEENELLRNENAELKEVHNI